MKRLKVERGGWKVNANRRMEEFRRIVYCCTGL